ncbi:MAG: hypothetical protein P4L87_20425 [Formivibrio sp.]|nr:hypothetical protein [Formivibrio sp.]
MTGKLEARLAKLESHVAAKDVDFSSVVFGEFNRTDYEIVGVVGGNRQVVARQSGETVEAIVGRAQRQLREKIIFLVYSEGRTGDTCVVFPKELHGGHE